MDKNCTDLVFYISI